MNNRILQTSDGWIAATLPRESDIELLPAWVGVATVDELPDAVRTRTSRELVDQAALLGLAVSSLCEYTGPTIVSCDVENRAPALNITRTRVLDLSGLWAGPLAASLLAADGARVVKAESIQRPDNLQQGRPDLYDELNHNKEIVTFDWNDLEALRSLIAEADVVVESSRARALEQRGIFPQDTNVHVWASITGYGRASNRIAFGDDAAFAGGLVRYKDGIPHFKGDAVADPLTGQAAYEAITQALREPQSVLLDIAMAGVARDHAVREGLRPPQE